MHEKARKEAVEKIIANADDDTYAIDEIADVRGWFRPKLTSPFYPIVQLYLSGKFSLKETIDKIWNLYHTEPEALKGTDKWYSILHSAKRMPHWSDGRHQMLAALVVAWTECTTKSTTTGTPQDDDDFLQKWCLAPALREVFNDCPGVGSGFTLTERHAWMSLNAFLAHLIKMLRSRIAEPADNDTDLFRKLLAADLHSYALSCVWTMRDALEEEHTDDPPFPNEVSATARQKMDARVPAAAMWAIVLGKTLHSMDIDMSPTEPNQGNPARGGKLWKHGKPALCKERRAFWKSRFAEFKDKPDGSIDDEARQLAQEAFKAMEVAESDTKVDPDTIVDSDTKVESDKGVDWTDIVIVNNHDGQN